MHRLELRGSRGALEVQKPLAGTNNQIFLERPLRLSARMTLARLLHATSSLLVHSAPGSRARFWPQDLLSSKAPRGAGAVLRVSHFGVSSQAPGSKEPQAVARVITAFFGCKLCGSLVDGASRIPWSEPEGSTARPNALRPPPDAPHLPRPSPKEVRQAVINVASAYPP